MSTREANTQGGTLESGCLSKEKIKDDRTMKHGNEQTQRPQPNPTISAPRGHKIK